MTKEELKEIEGKLLSEKTKIEGEMAKLKEGLDFGDDVDNFEEETDEAEERGTYLGIKKTQDARLEQINKALEKIRRGRYGVCEKCGGPIERKILDVDPESLYCKNCKRGL
ncbi:MAG: TraR/DksA C4-type zinc finger protein [Minisyncoccia bacterium]|jgi:DnaK suppressor protein